jgi:hypothetical protein
MFLPGTHHALAPCQHLFVVLRTLQGAWISAAEQWQAQIIYERTTEPRTINILMSPRASRRIPCCLVWHTSSSCQGVSVHRWQGRHVAYFHQWLINLYTILSVLQVKSCWNRRYRNVVMQWERMYCGPPPPHGIHQTIQFTITTM